MGTKIVQTPSSRAILQALRAAGAVVDLSTTSNAESVGYTTQERLNVTAVLYGFGPVAGAINPISETLDNSTFTLGKLHVLSGRANAANPAWVEGGIVPFSTDLQGRARTLPTPFQRSSGVAAFPTWRLAAPVTAPAAGAALVTVAAVVGQINRVFGVMAHQESETIDNLVELREAATVRSAFGVTGTSGQIISPVPILVPAANTAVSLNSRNAPGAGIDVVGALLVETAA